MSRFANIGVRNLNNVFTGISLTGAGRALAYTTAIGAVGFKALRNQTIPNNIFGHNIAAQAHATPGIHQPLSMMYDGRSNPTMGADGALTLALSKLR